MRKKFIGSRAFYGRVFSVMIPVLIQNVITNFVSLLDNIMVGQVGTEQMSGVAIVNQLLFVFILAVFGGLSGAGIFSAQYFGKGDAQGVQNTFRIKMYISVGVTVLSAGILLLWGEPLIRLFLHEGGEKLDLAATLVSGREYLAVMLIGLLPFAVTQAYSTTLRETGEAMVPMKAGIAAVFVNMFFNYVLIFGKLGAPVMGVTGAATATVISRFTECGIVVIWAHTHPQRCVFIPGVYRSLRVPRPLVKSVCILGLPLLINELMWSGGLTAMNQCFSTRGLAVVSAVNISSTVTDLFYCAYKSMGVTVSIIIGQLLGAGETERAVDEDRKLIFFSVVLCTAAGGLMALLAPLFPMIYNTTDYVKRLACVLIIVNAAVMPAHGFTNTCYFTLRSGGKSLLTFLFDGVFVWAVYIPAAMLLAHLTAMPIIPMFACVQAIEYLKVIFGFILLRRGTWVNRLVADTGA